MSVCIPTTHSGRRQTTEQQNHLAKTAGGDPDSAAQEGTGELEAAALNDGGLAALTGQEYGDIDMAAEPSLCTDTISLGE